MLPELRLLPWEDDHASPFAHATSSAKFRGVQSEFALKVRENLLFFRPLHATNDELFARRQPIANTAEEAQSLENQPQILEKLFQNALNASDWGQVFCVPLPNMHGQMRGMMVCILGEEGKSWIRALYDDGGEAFEFSSDAKMLRRNAAGELKQQDETKIHRFLRDTTRDFRRTMVNGAIPPNVAARGNRDWSFQNGDLTTLKALFDGAIHLFDDLEPNTQRWLAVGSQTQWQKAKAEASWLSTHHPNLALKRAFELALEICAPQGHALGWRFGIYPLWMDIRLGEPSMHEKMEAAWQWKQIARGTAFEEAVAQLMKEAR